MKVIIRIYNIILVLLAALPANTQNLLPNPSFENTITSDYQDPVNALLNLVDWYPVNYYPVDTLYRGTPDLFDVNHLWPNSSPANFWNVVNGAAEGDKHIGIANHLKLEGYLTPEALATSIVEPLEPGQYYYIEISTRNKGVSGYLNNPPMLCVPLEFKKIEVLLHSDSLFVTIDEQNKESFSNADQSFALQSDRMRSDLVGNWHQIGTCFQADGTEKFFGLTTTSGNFTVNPPCVISEDHWSAFYIYYFDVDDVKLIKLPDEFTVTTTICTEQNTKINIRDLVDLPVMQNEIEFHWEDGVVDSVNYISTGGIYHIDAILDCKTIPIHLEVTGLDCVPKIFVPNAFSPNGDGINDNLEVFLSLDLPIQQFRFSVYNRWGAEVFSTNNSDVLWDGTVRGRPLKTGVYIWLLEYTVDDINLGPTTYKETGDITLLR